ncbi:MAG: RICIN domain-containing protein [Acidobacteriota bacterium]|nr:RICIN domain-containing protein [Acidobacteriota bacterium]
MDSLPVSGNSAAYVQTVGTNSGAHPDFGSNPGNGVPITTVPGTQPKVPIAFRYQSDPGPYPIPQNPLIEGGSDRHILLVDTTNCVDYEIFSAASNGNGTWSAGSGAIFPLNSNQLRTAGETSADAAGLPILPGLVRYDEVASGQINHALRITIPVTDDTFIWPARHEASSVSGTQYPPMGQRFRLKQSFNVTPYAPHVQVILNALKTYGMIVADNGGPWFISGTPDARWNDDELHQLTQVQGSNFEAVDESALMTDPNSGQVAQPGASAIPNPGVPTNTWVQLISKNSGMCLDVFGPERTQSLAHLEQWTCWGGSNQAFEFTPVGGGYKITAQSSGLQLDIAGGPNAIQDGAPVIQYPYWGGTNEIWNVTPRSDGYFTVSPVSSGKCLDVAGESTSDGATVQQWTCWGGPNQAWQFVPTL